MPDRSTMERQLAAYYRAWESQDREGILATTGSTFQFRSPMDNFDSAEDFLDKCLDRFGGMKFDFEARLYGNDQAVVLYSMPEPSGMPVAEHLVFSGDRITAIQVFFGGTGARTVTS